MNVLWVSAHPDSRSLTGSLRTAGVAALAADGHDVVESDLYRMNWNPVVTGADFAHSPETRLYVAGESRRALDGGQLSDDIAVEQRKLLDADAVVLQFPLWWFGMPAILKGWVDRVFVEGFGYGIRAGDGPTRRYGDGTLAGKRAVVVTTIGGSDRTVSPRGINGDLYELLFPIQHGMLWYTGMSVLPPVLVASADRMTPDAYSAAEAEVTGRMHTLFDDDPIPFRTQNDGSYDAQFVLRDEHAAGSVGMRAHLRHEPPASLLPSELANSMHL